MRSNNIGIVRNLAFISADIAGSMCPAWWKHSPAERPDHVLEEEDPKPKTPPNA